ncbi:MAG: hypothetical protein SOR23_06150 [Candidatus Enterosoma sp.]|nr:hypothetical protein [Candidatus Enterosoma sp.]
MNKETFLKSEAKAAKLFINSRKTGRLSSAYLLYGERNAPLKESALFLAKSLGCEKDLLACDECDSCKRFDKGIHPDFVLINGETTRIKKEDIQNLQDKFSESAFEKGHRLCYVIHRVENITEKAANTILKFLEEPREGQVAILTSYNIDKVLKTILSRSVLVRIDPIDEKEMQRELLENPIVLSDNDEDKKKKKKEEDISFNEGEAYILSHYFSSYESVKETLQNDRSFLEGYQIAEGFLNDLTSSVAQAGYTLLFQTSLKKGATCYNWMYLIIHEVFAAVLLNDVKEDNPFRDIIMKLSKNKNKIARADAVVKEALAYQHINYNPTLLSARLIKALDEEK